MFAVIAVIVLVLDCAGDAFDDLAIALGIGIKAHDLDLVVELVAVSQIVVQIDHALLKPIIGGFLSIGLRFAFHVENLAVVLEAPKVFKDVGLCAHIAPRATCAIKPISTIMMRV